MICAANFYKDVPCLIQIRNPLFTELFAIFLAPILYCACSAALTGLRCRLYPKASMTNGLYCAEICLPCQVKTYLRAPITPKLFILPPLTKPSNTNGKIGFKQFEALLKTMYWMSASVHLETELSGKHTFNWHSERGHTPADSELRMSCEWETRGTFCHLNFSARIRGQSLRRCGGCALAKLSPDALEGVLDEYVSREGTDYGDYATNMAAKNNKYSNSCNRASPPYCLI